LHVFDYGACLKQDVDVTALAFLRQLLVLGKKLELGCSYERIQAVVGAYHDIERELRSPSLGWSCDSLGLDGSNDHHDSVGQRCSVLPLPITSTASAEEESGKEVENARGTEGESYGKSYQHFAGSLADGIEPLSPPLFKEERSVEEEQCRKNDIHLLNQIQRVADLIVGSMDEFDPIGFSTYLEEHGQGTGFRHGPGAVAERLKQHEKSCFPNWSAKLQSRFPFEFCGKTAGDLWRSVPLNHEVASRLIDVPKTTKGPRLIAAESTAHQWCQQLVMRFLFDESRRLFGSQKRVTKSFRGIERSDYYVNYIDFKNQKPSGDLVLEASLDRSLATVDLSDASDRLTCWTVERVFRKNPSLLTALHAARTRYLRDDISEERTFIKLKKFASQGTAVTFPVMSITMLCIALGASLMEAPTWHSLRKLRTKVRVFGDDIIIPKHGYARLVRAMELLQLKVNTAKSYVNGHFRESCGVDGYLGYDVTPIKPKTLVADSPASCQAVVDNTNNLFNKGYWHASTACFELLPARLRRGIRIVGPNDAGFRGVTSFTRGDESHLAKRWNSRLHRYEVRVWTLSVRTKGHQREGFPALLDFFASKHNHEHARIVSEFAEIRKTRIGLLWEPSNSDARISP
jgi:hypothetical protein